MRRQLKRVCSALLAAVLLVTAVPGTAMTSYAVNSSGEEIMEEVTGEITPLADDTGVESTGNIQLQLNFQKNITEEEQQVILEGLKVQSPDGEQQYETTIPLYGESEKDFQIELPGDYTITGIRVDYSTSNIRYGLAQNFKDNIFTLKARKNSVLEGDVAVNVIIGRVKAIDFYVQFPEFIEEAEVLFNNEKVDLVDDIAHISNEGSVVVKVKPKVNRVVSAKYEVEGEGAPVACASSYTEEGFLYYELGKLYDNTWMVFTTTEGYDIRITMEDDIDLSIYGLPEDGAGEGRGVENGSTYSVPKDHKLSFQFSMDSEKFNDHKLQITATSGEGEVTEVPWRFDEDAYVYLCGYTVDKNAELSFRWVAKETYEVDFATENASVYRFVYQPDNDEIYPEEEYTEETVLQVYEDKNIIFGVKYGFDYVLESVTAGEDNEELESIYTYKDDEANYAVYRYQPSSDTTIAVKAVPRGKYNVTLDCENVTAYTVYQEEGSYYISEPWEDRAVYAGNKVTFAISCANTHKLEKVSLVGGEANTVKLVHSYTEDGESYYYIYTFQPTADSTIEAKAVPKENFTLKFEQGNYYISGEYFDTSSGETEFELIEGVYSFGVVLNEEGQRIKMVTTAGDSQSPESGKLSSYYNGESYLYKVNLTQDTTVTVLTEEIPQRTVQISGAGAIVENVEANGDPVEETENGYVVSDRNTLSFRVREEDGYRIEKVSVAGENGYTLWPVKSEEGNNYSVLVGSDLVIQVEAVEKTTTTVTVETSNASITTDAVEDGEGNYTVYKEENFVFRVEAEEGYVVESVLSNGEKLQPQYDPYGNSTYYQIMVEEDVDLSVVAETPEENEVHFKGNGYNEESLAIWSASESYSPVDGTIEVTSSEEIWFDLPDNIHQIAKVTCTDINGESKTLYRTYYHGNEGYYLGNIAEEIEIEITRGTTYQLTFSGNNDEKFMPLEGLGIFPETVYVPVNEALDFKVVASAGNILTGISCKGASLKGSLKTGIYQMIPKKSSDLLVQVSSGSAWHQRCVFDHQPEDVAVSCFINGEEASLVNNAVVIPSTESFVLKVKPLNGKKVLLSYDDSETIEVTEVEEDGTYVYELNASKISGDHLKIDTYKANVVEFSGSNLQIWVGEFNEDGYLSWTEAGNSISVKENKTLLFRVTAEGGYKVSDVTVEDKTAGELATKNYYDEYTGMTVSYYSIKPEKDTTINVITEEIPAHNYQFIFDESKVELYIGTYSYYYDEWDYDFEWEEGGKEYRKQVVNGKYNDVLFRVVPKEGYKVSLVSTTEDESGKLSAVRDEGRDVSYYVLQNIGDATITIVAEEIVDYNVTFEWDEGIRFVEISNRGEIQNHETISVSNTELIRIFTAPKRMELPSSEEVDMYHLVSATANGKVLEKFYDADESGYYYYKLSNLKEDTTVVIETEYNPDVINRLYFTTGEEETLYNAFYYKETEDEEGNVDSEKVYLDLEDTFPVFGRNQLIGIEPEDGYGIIKVEFYRNGKVTTLSPNEDGLYNIFYPFSMGMEGTIVVSTFKLKTMAENVAVENVANGKLTQYADTVKDYHLVFTPEDADITQMGVEIIAAEGQQADVVSAEIVDRKLRVTTKAVTNKEEAATVKFYDIDAKTGEKVYVDGGTFTVSTAKQAIFAEGAVKAEVKKADDATLTMELTAPEGLAELNEGAYYYKVVVTPQAGEGQEIPEEIRNATENPFYIAVEEEAQEVQLLLNANGVGKGQAWTYDIAVALVQTKNRDGLDYITATEKVIFESPLHTLEPVTTKNPYYQDKVVLQDQVKQMYTVQGELAVAKVVFDENNSDPRVSQVTDITELDGKGDALTVWEENGIIYANAGTDTLIGKHTIEVTLAAPEYMNKTKGTFVVTVIKGIENLTVTVPSAEIYKESKKAATVKAEVAYNEGTEAPKTKKVIWEVVKPNGEAFAAGDALYGVLSMSNGKVTVNKSFVPTERTEDNQFCIKATAADYQGNTAFAMSEVITLMNKPIEISKICLVAPAEGGYQVVVKEGSEITTNVLENAFVVALKEDAPEKEIYTEEELSNYSISPALLTYKTSNKAVVVQEEEKVTLTSGKTAKNIVLTISTNDGGKKKATMKFSVVYAAPEALGLEVWDGDQRLGEALAKDISFAGTTNTRLTVKVKQKAGESWSDLNALVNYKLSVKNGKIISSDAVKGIYEIIVTAKKVTITLDNKTVNAKAKEIYQITNTAYSEAKAPKVKTASKLICGVMDNRSVVYQLSGYDYSNKAVMVETDFMDRNKKAEVYDQFETALLNENHPIAISADGKLVLNFAGSNIPAGSYKLKLTFGTDENAESFVADAKPVTVTLKAVKPKVTKGSYSAPTSYKLDTKAGNSVKLIGKGKNVIENSVCYFDLKNSNVKGKQNNFLTYFELKDNILSLKEGVTEADIAYLKSKNGKNDLTAYVTYTVAYGDDGYGNPFTAEKTVKITVKLK